MMFPVAKKQVSIETNISSSYTCDGLTVGNEHGSEGDGKNLQDFDANLVAPQANSPGNGKEHQNSKNAAAQPHKEKDLNPSDDHKEGKVETKATAVPTMHISSPDFGTTIQQVDHDASGQLVVSKESVPVGEQKAVTVAGGDAKGSCSRQISVIIGRNAGHTPDLSNLQQAE